MTTARRRFLALARRLIAALRDESLECGDPCLHRADAFGEAFEGTSLGMAIVGTKGQWLRVNHSFCEIVGYTRDELLAMDFQSITHPEDLVIDLRNLEEMLSGEMSRFETEKRYIHKDGRLVWVCLTVTLVRGRDRRPRYFMSQVLDITRRKVAEEAVRRSEERYRVVAENFPNGSVYLFDEDLRAIVADGTGFRSMGFTKQMLEGKTIWEAFPPDLCAAIESPCRAALAGVTTRTEVVFAANVFEVDFLPIRDSRGSVICGMAMTQNITKRKAAERRVAEQLTELRRWQQVTIGREARIQHLKREINTLRRRLGEPSEFDSQDRTALGQHGAGPDSHPDEVGE